jgi:Ca2+-transporting ATPase
VDPAGIVHARATPEDKIGIVRRLRESGEVVAMTGDGVNDAPALREADIGIAMGRTATEVTREAADLVLADDNYASIVAAVREGRGIFANIRKTIVYLLSGNAGELAVMFGAALLGLPAPLLPLQLLWINLFTDGLPALVLVADPPEADVLRRPPRPPAEPLLGGRQWAQVLATGLLDAAVALGVFAWAAASRGLPEARTLAFSTLVFIELFRVFSSRSDRKVFWETAPFSNLLLLAVVGVTAIVQVSLPHVPWSQHVLGIVPLSGRDCALAVGLGLVPVTVIEVVKLLRRAAALDPAVESR